MSEGRVCRVRDSAYRAGVMYGGITRPSPSRYLYPCSPMRRSSRFSAWSSSEYSPALNPTLLPLVLGVPAIMAYLRAETGNR
jgi:hypothetical protein